MTIGTPELKDQLSSLTDEQFCHLVLRQMKDVIPKDQQAYFKKTKLEKWIIYLARELEFDNIGSGWYKYGPHSFYVNNMLEDCRFLDLSQGICVSINIPNKLYESLYKVICDTKPLFSKSINDLFKWCYEIYIKKTNAKQYKNFYINKLKFENYFAYDFMNQFKKYHNQFNTEGYELHTTTLLEKYDKFILSIPFVDDNNATYNLFTFSKLLESALKCKYNTDIPFLQYQNYYMECMDIYTKYILAPITPFNDTLIGSENAKEKELSTLSLAINNRKNDEALRIMNNLKRDAKSKGIFPSAHELRNILIKNQKQMPKNRKIKINNFISSW